MEHLCLKKKKRKEEKKQNNDVQLNCMNQVHVKSWRGENMGVCVQSDLNTKQHLGEYLKLSLLKSPPTSQRHTAALFHSCCCLNYFHCCMRNKVVFGRTTPRQLPISFKHTAMDCNYRCECPFLSQEQKYLIAAQTFFTTFSRGEGKYKLHSKEK